MNCYERNLEVNLSVCGFGGKMTVTGALNVFMDTAKLHEDILGSGIEYMRDRGLFWIIGRNRVKFYKTPQLMDKVVVKTWPLAPSKLFLNREYSIEDESGELMVAGESLWLVLRPEDKKLLEIKDYFPKDLKTLDKKMFDYPAARIVKNFDDNQKIGEFVVGPEDIDFIGHMNNAAYSRAIMNFIPTDELKKHPVKEFEINYNLQCMEGEHIDVFKRDAECGFEFGGFNKEGESVLTAKIIF